MNQLSNLNASYIAGFLDGDGSIHVRLKPNVTYKYGFQIAPNIVFYQSSKEPLVLKTLRDMIGGGYLRFRNDGIVEFIIGDTDTMRDLIIQIESYLIVKKLQAKLLLKIFDQKAKVKNKEDFLALAQIIDQFQDLNYSKNRKNNSLVVADWLKLVTP